MFHEVAAAGIDRQVSLLTLIGWHPIKVFDEASKLLPADKAAPAVAYITVPPHPQPIRVPMIPPSLIRVRHWLADKNPPHGIKLVRVREREVDWEG
jgi:hypothetical protein